MYQHFVNVIFKKMRFQRYSPIWKIFISTLRRNFFPTNDRSYLSQDLLWNCWPLLWYYACVKLISIPTRLLRGK
jgi:hypothetical protein